MLPFGNMNDENNETTKKKPKSPDLWPVVMFVVLGPAVGAGLGNVPLGGALGGFLGFVYGAAAYVLHARKHRGPKED